MSYASHKWCRYGPIYGSVLPGAVQLHLARAGLRVNACRMIQVSYHVVVRFVGIVNDVSITNLLTVPSTPVRHIIRAWGAPI